MAAPSVTPAPEKILVVMPTWFGDCLMATPALRALRETFPQAHLAALVREPMAPLLEGLAFLDDVQVHGGAVTRSGAGRSSGGGRGTSAFRLAGRLKQLAYDTAVLLPNSFRSAALVRMAKIPRRVGYDRDGRGVLLTDRLVARHDGKHYVPVPALDYYLSLAHYLGAVARPGDHLMAVATRDKDDELAASLLASAKGRPVALLNPGAAKPEKRWAPQSFAQLAGRLHNELGFAVAVTGSPDEREAVARVAGAAPCRVIDLLKAGTTLGQLKSVVARSRLLVTNDTGPRHLAAALGTPVVTLFGPTLPAWTEIGFADERQVVSPAPDAPDAMRQITVTQVFDAAAELTRATQTEPAADASAEKAGAAGKKPAARA